MSRRTPTMAPRKKKAPIACKDCKVLALQVKALEARVAELEKLSGLTAPDKALLTYRKMRRAFNRRTPMELLFESAAAEAEAEG